ncbi:MAG: serine hydrolase [Gemmatimonadetes bacterium]|nr:serine hydrolase [Gemmatimonadota bacterium]
MVRRSRGLVALLMLVAVARPVAAQSRADRAESYLRAYHDLGRFNGAALVVDRGSVLYEGALGLADLDTGELATPSTRFRIASLTKQFTAALVLRLEELGRLRVDATVAAYIEEYPKPQADRITIHHLLNHTSGLPSYTDIPGFLEHRGVEPLAPGEIVALTWSEPLRFEPGSDFEYSNSGYALLGWIVERVTGVPYHAALREHVLEPLGLTDTGYDHDEIPPSGHARGFTRDLDGHRAARPLDPSIPYSAGMLYSTVSDLGRWTAALLGWTSPGPFEDPSTGVRMMAPGRNGYGYGIGSSRRDVGRETEIRTVEHTGGIFGFTSVLRAFPDHERAIVLLDNTSSDLRPIVEGLTNLLWGAEAVRPAPSIARRILPIVESAGVEPALARYRDWRRTRPDEYEYGPSELLELARYFRDRDTAVAVAILEAAVEDHPELPVPRLALADLYAETGDTTRAAGVLETALTYEPGLPVLLERLLSLGIEPAGALRIPRADVPTEALAILVGEYRIDPATALAIELGEGGLSARRTGEPAFPLLPQSPTTFLLHGSKVQLAFELEEGRPVAVAVLEAGRRLRFPIAPSRR